MKCLTEKNIIPFSLPISLMMIVRIRVLYLIIIIKSEVWPICHCFIYLFIYFDIFHFGPSEKNFGEFWFKIKVYSCNKIPLQMSSAKMAAILFRSRCVKLFMCFRYRLDELGCFGQLCSMSAGVIIDAWALHAVRFGYRNPKWRWYTKLWYVTTVTMSK